MKNYQPKPYLLPRALAFLSERDGSLTRRAQVARISRARRYNMLEYYTAEFQRREGIARWTAKKYMWLAYYRGQDV